MSGRYRTIVADPPWDHSDGTGVHITVGLTGKTRPEGLAVTRIPYETMTVEQIHNLPIADLADERGAHLYLWTTNRYLPHVWSVAARWGFTGVCIITWCKPASGWMPGGTWPSNTEFCLFATSGNLAALSRAPGRWFEAPRRRGAPVKAGHRSGGHSAKPEAFMDMVEQVSPGPYLELFARRQRLGWDTWGDEALEHVELV